MEVEEGRQHLETQQCYFLSIRLCFTLREMIFLLVSMRPIPFKSISAVSLSLEPSRDDGWLVIIVTVGASSFVFRHFKISVSSADHNCRCIGITYQFLRCVKVSGLYHHSFPKQKPPLTGKTYSNTTEEPPPQSF